MWTMLLAQAVAGPTLPAPPRPRSDAPCPLATGDEVVVCGRADDHYRLRPLPARADEPAITKAEIGLSHGTRLGVEAEQGQDAQGGPINRAMVRLKIRF